MSEPIPFPPRPADPSLTDTVTLPRDDGSRRNRQLLRQAVHDVDAQRFWLLFSQQANGTPQFSGRFDDDFFREVIALALILRPPEFTQQVLTRVALIRAAQERQATKEGEKR